MNISLVVFNMIPAFPMDGGRVLRAVLSVFLGPAIATEIAAALGGVLAFGFVIGSLFGSPMLLLIGLFVFVAGRQELLAVRAQEMVRRAAQSAPSFSTNHAGFAVDATQADPAAPIDPGFSGFIWDDRGQVWVLWRHGRPVQAYYLPAE